MHVLSTRHFCCAKNIWTITTGTDSEQDITFDVSQVGVPVLVKVSYFPNWEVDGADGPYRIAPNSMVVVPTSTHVRLHYEPQALDRIAYLLTFLGIALMIFWRVRGDVRHRSAHPFITLPDGVGPEGSEPEDDGVDEPEDVTADGAFDPDDLVDDEFADVGADPPGSV
ncbi:MAG TPA: hypothetical protein PK735_07515 [Flavobacteriales bacterium]|nr:hypothetical protein [Flavobacteriales bacterium]